MLLTITMIENRLQSVGRGRMQFKQTVGWCSLCCRLLKSTHTVYEDYLQAVDLKYL